MCEMIKCTCTHTLYIHTVHTHCTYTPYTHRSVHLLFVASLACFARRIYAEAPQFVLDAGNAKGGRWEGDGVDGPGVYEYRKYQLPLGYVTVPNFLEIYAEGVAEKVGLRVTGIYWLCQCPVFLLTYLLLRLASLAARASSPQIQHQDPTTSLCTVMYTEVGKLNEVIEVWRHSCVGGMESSRFMAREAPKWREAIGKMAEIAVTFENEIVNPVGFSNWK